MATRKFSDLRAAIAADPIRAERLRHVTEKVDQLYEAYQVNLKQLRQARNLTQTQLARVLGISQPEVSRIEGQTDVYLSTLQSYVAAMGGELKLLVVFNDEESNSVELGDLLPGDSPPRASDLTVTVTSEKAASEDSGADVGEVLAAAAIGGDHRHQALKGIAGLLRRNSMPNLACVVVAFAAESLAEAGDRIAAARELGAGGAAARQSRRLRIAEHLWRRSLDFDPTNVRSRSALGQLLHHQGRYAEAVENLETVASMDNYATLFLGWSRLMVGLEDQNDTSIQAGLNDVITGLHRWSYEANFAQRQGWLRNVKRLDDLGSRFRQDVDNLLAFASSNSNFGRVSRDDLAELAAAPSTFSSPETSFELGTVDSTDEAGR
jgi:transcriptional regulator with XRE-family HTH domain